MYTSRHYREERTQVIYPLIERNSFAILVSQGQEGIAATHLPLLLDRDAGEQGILRGHLARGNQQWRHLAEGAEVLAIFSGPDAYVSPHVYVDEPDVPTWNYLAAHIYGRCRLIQDRSQVMVHLEALISRFEGAAETAWELRSLDSAMIDGLYRGIVAFEMEITRIECGLKVSQDKTPRDREAVIRQLETEQKDECRELAAFMRAYDGYPVS